MADVVSFTHKLCERIADLEDELDRTKDPIPVNLPDGLPPMEGSSLGFEDIDAAFNMRGWLQKACEAQGAKMIGGGFGGGVADIQIVLEGHEYWLTIKALTKSV